MGTPSVLGRTEQLSTLGSRPHKHFGHLDKDSLSPPPTRLPGNVGGCGEPTLFSCWHPAVVALLFVALATGKGNPHLGGRGGPSNHTHRYTQAHMRPPTRNSVRHRLLYCSRRVWRERPAREQPGCPPRSVPGGRTTSCPAPVLPFPFRPPPTPHTQP